MTIHERVNVSVALALVASYLMALAGTKKRLLRWRSTPAVDWRPIVRRLSDRLGAGVRRRASS